LRVVVEEEVHGGGTNCVSSVEKTGRGPVDNHANWTRCRVFPPIPWEHSIMLEDKSCNDATIIQYLYGKDRVAVLVWGVVKLYVVFAHSEEAVMFFPIFLGCSFFLS